MDNTCRLCLKESQEIIEELCEGCDVLDKLSVSLSHSVRLLVLKLTALTIIQLLLIKVVCFFNSKFQNVIINNLSYYL